MSDPKRLILDSPSDVERVLLRAGRIAVPTGAKNRAFAVAQAAALPTGVSASAFVEKGLSSRRGRTDHLAMLRFVGSVVLAGSAMAGVAMLVRHEEVGPLPVIAAQNAAVATSTSAIAATEMRPARSDDRVPPRADGPTPSPPTPARSTATHWTTPVAAASAIETRRPKKAPPAQANPPTLSDQIAVLDDARRVLSEGRPSDALSILDRYAQLFPDGVMAPEAKLLRIEALVKSGDRPAAVRLADALRSDDPHGPYAERVRSLLNAEGP